MPDIFQFLQQHGIAYQHFEHSPVFTCEDVEKLPAMPGTQTKNLLLCSRKGKQYWLVIVGHDKSVDIRVLAAALGVDSLSFASAERLQQVFGVEAGAVSLLGLLNDTECRATVIFDEPMWRVGELQCHPLMNSATLVIAHAGIEGFLRATNHVWQIMDIPARLQ